MGSSGVSQWVAPASQMWPGARRSAWSIALGGAVRANTLGMHGTASMNDGGAQGRLGLRVLLAGNAAAAVTFMLTYFACLAPAGMIKALSACSLCSRGERLEIIVSTVSGVATALLLAPFAFLVMLPIALLMTPLTRFVLSRSMMATSKVIIGGVVGALVGFPMLIFIFGLDGGLAADQTRLLLFAGLSSFVAPSAAAGAAFTCTAILMSRPSKPRTNHDLS